MHYARLGLGGPTLSRLACAALRPDPACPDAAPQAARSIGQALDAGINLFDTTSCMDGLAESLLAKALGKRRAEVLISSRLGARRNSTHSHPGLSRADMVWSIEQSMKRLGSDWLDLCVVPHEDPYTPLEETLQTLDDMVRSGKVRYLGFANWPAWKAAKALELQQRHGWAPFCFGELHYALNTRSPEREAIPMLQSYGLGLIVKPQPAGMPFSNAGALPTQGYLTGATAPDSPRSNHRLAELMRDIAASHQASTKQIALSWLLARDTVSSIVPAFNSAMQHAEALHATTLQLSATELLLLDAASAPTPLLPDWFVPQEQMPAAQVELARSCA
ncbi:aldo/keto reductase [Aquitalea magnusonii]|uniref:Aryl-alcohol dehydrogenase-like predicted oxidoreductase n=1 Tax=Aquitalea magnusonii TaxID=332411 RepID=A0A318JP99_9NEIS|nr:aldo/keto reductase [Aquitalea magnusonii]PXX50415.1 aryl-alcohol dehydrogenase-like predicted oxidoreductase [Aquitalea magnusonii]